MPSLPAIYIYKPHIPTSQERKGKVTKKISLAMELEDDLFFADLSKQISLLIMDDDEDPVATGPSVSFQAFSRGNYPITAPSQFMYDQNCRRESCKGTGVFIPKSSQPRRKHRQGRYSQKSCNRQHDNTRVVSQVSYSNSFKSKKG